MADKFTFTAGTPLEIAEEVATELAFITRSISPLLVEIGYPGDIEVVGNPVHSWGEDALLGNSATVNGALSAVATAITVDTPLGLNFVIGDGFPDKVTAFRVEMAVHGRYGEPCPACGSPVQRIVYASNEANYCATCQTGGKLLADRALSRLLKGDWPKRIEDLDDRMP